MGPSTGCERPDGPDTEIATELLAWLHSERDLAAFLQDGPLDGLWIWNLERPEQVWTTQSFLDLLGCGDRRSDGGREVLERVHPADVAAARDALDRHLADPSSPYDRIVRYRHSDGSTVWVRSRGLALRDGDGRAVRFVAVQSDLTASMEVRQRLAASLQELEDYATVLERLDAVTVALNRMSEPDEVIASLIRTLGSEVGDLAVLVVPAEPGTYRIAALDGEDPERLAAVERMFADRPLGDTDQGPIATVLRTGESVLVSHVTGAELVRRVDDDARVDVAGNLPRSFVCVPWNGSGDICGAVLTVRNDATRRPFVDRDLTLVRQIVERHGSTFRQLRAQLETRAVSRFRELAREAPMAILQIDAAGTCTFVNDQWTALTGFGPERSLGSGWLEVFNASDLAGLRKAWIDARDRGEVLKVEVRLCRADGRTVWAGGSSVAQFDDDGTYAGALIAVSDVTTRREVEAELSRRARVDPLTGDANRFALFERLDVVLADVQVHDCVIGLVYLDLDSFKEVNDSLGHEVGDQVLVAVADRLRSVLRDTDTCARVGGDEFVLVLDRLNGPGSAAALVERIRRLIRPPFDVSGMAIHLAASMGVVTVSRRDGELRADEVVRRADRAMYRAKAAGRDCWEAYDPALDDEAHSEGTVRQQIAEALWHGHLVLHYQPIVELSTARMVGVEALVRIDHPTDGLLAPGRFLDVAERSGQIVAVGRWVVAEATRQLARWHTVRPDLYLALNLSGRQIADAGAADLIIDAVRDNGLRADRLVVELTETTLVRAISSAVAAVGQIRAAGVRIAIDDFGTGYSSLARLTEIPADMIKLDRSFIVNAPIDPVHAAVVSAVMHLTDRVSLDVIAEGIETSDQLRTIQELGCSVGQGFLFSRPVPAPELDAVLAGAFVTKGGPAANFGA